ncbi:MAG: GIY-YIG nuclease family protein [Bacilli bacterium]|nr:GIY-YIG nuclease family protein [Bacilli bacterium]
MNNELGYIYIYKCVVGSGSDVCKIGITKDYHKRLQQHVRTPYYGFLPYVEFTTGNPIATIFKVNDYSSADAIINKVFHDNQFGNFEIYSIDYDDAIKKLYEELKNTNRLIELIKDNYSLYSFLNNDEVNVKTNKKEFENIREQLLVKYSDSLPEELMSMLKDKNTFIENCHSHYTTGNYIEFPYNLVLDLNYNKARRIEILNKLKALL